jgi:hypothetical protein
MFLFGCACQNRQTLSFGEAKFSKPFQAVVENSEMHEVLGDDRTGYLAVEIRLRRVDGTVVPLATDRATLMESAFAVDLTNGASYWWPKAITDFEAEVRAERERNTRSTSSAKPKVNFMVDSQSTTNKRKNP